MKENDKSEHTGLGENSSPGIPLSDPALKTPMYTAINAGRYQRQELIKKIQRKTNNYLLCYVSGFKTQINRDDIIGIMELLHNVPHNSNIDLLLHTGGGDIDAADKIVTILRKKVGEKGMLRIIVPDYAKSAGTLIALAAEKIVMSDSSELGPIDPQFPKRDGDGNALQHSVMNYLEAYETLCEKLRSTPNDVPAAVLLSKFDSTTVVLFNAISARARTLAEKYLNRYMFHETNGKYTAIASNLMDTKKWLSHGQMIGLDDAKEMGLEVTYLKNEDEDWQLYWSLYCLQRLAITDNQKLFESDFASLPM